MLRVFLIFMLVSAAEKQRMCRHGQSAEGCTKCTSRCQCGDPKCGQAASQ